MNEIEIATEVPAEDTVLGETSSAAESETRRESWPEPTNKLQAVVSKERIPESIVKETEMSGLSDSDSEQPVLKRSKQARVPCRRYLHLSGPTM